MVETQDELRIKILEDIVSKQQHEIIDLREELAQVYIELSGKTEHTSDCATSNAPAMKPGRCNCGNEKSSIKVPLDVSLLPGETKTVTISLQLSEILHDHN